MHTITHKKHIIFEKTQQEALNIWKNTLFTMYNVSNVDISNKLIRY